MKERGRGGRIKNHVSNLSAAPGRFKDELQLEAWTIGVLKVNGWLVTSMRDSRKQMREADRGIPDIIAVHPDRALSLLRGTAPVGPAFLAAEMKMPGKKPSPEQRRWLEAFHMLSEAVNSWYRKEFSTPYYAQALAVRVWYPADEKRIIETAGGKIPLW